MKKEKENRQKIRYVLAAAALIFLAVFFQEDFAESWRNLPVTGTKADTYTAGRSEYSDQNAADSDRTEKALQQSEDELQVHFLDVGQSDATLLLCGGHAMLIDAGDNNKGTTVQLYLHKQGVGEGITLDYVIGTHPHSDHIGGLDVIINKFEIGTIFLTDYTTEMKTYLDVVEAMEYYHYEKEVPKPGDTVMLGTAKVTFVAPNREDYEDLNNSSIGVLVEHGRNRFLFLGDAQKEAEWDILQNGIDLSDITVYKVSHHGSSDSSSVPFLEVIRPQYAVISAGEGNDYGHPHAQTLNRLRALGAKIYRTDEQGSIIAVSDGTCVTFNCAPSESE